MNLNSCKKNNPKKLLSHKILETGKDKGNKVESK